MKTLLLLLIGCPLLAWAQPDSLPHVRPTALKPIGSDLVPTYGRYGYGGRTQYTYDGLDVRSPKDLGQYILASGNETAIQEFNAYMSSRQAGTVLVVVGSGMAIGGLIGIMNARSAENSSNPFQGPPRSTTGPSGVGGMLVGVFGAGLIGVGWGMRLPGPHLRRAVQYYNRSLKQQQGISWQLKPYATYSNSGVGLVGRF